MRTASRLSSSSLVWQTDLIAVGRSFAAVYFLGGDVVCAVAERDEAHICASYGVEQSSELLGISWFRNT